MRHYHVKQDEEKNFWISEKHRFATIGELVQYHKSNGGGVCDVCWSGYCRQEQCTCASVCAHVWVCIRTCMCKHTVVINSNEACTTRLACV